MRTGLVLIISVVSLTGFGCAKKEGPSPTPKDAVRNFLEGMLELDKAKFLDSITGTDQELKAASVYIDYLVTVKHFKQAVIDKYGISGWAHFENQGGAKLSVNMTDNRDKLDSMKVVIDGDKATCTMPGEARAVNLLRKNGVWYVNVSDIVMTGGMDLDKFIGMWTKMSKLIKDKQQRIGKPNVTAVSLDMELGKGIMQIMMQNH